MKRLDERTPHIVRFRKVDTHTDVADLVQRSDQQASLPLNLKMHKGTGKQGG